MQDAESILGAKSRISVLRKLCASASRDYSICELADELGIDKSLVSRTVKELEKSKIVIVTKRRNLKLCQINANHNAYRFLLGVFDCERHLMAKKKGGFLWSG